MKIIKKIINDKNEIIIYKKNNKIFVDKIFSNQNIKYLKNEILGYRYFGKKKYFNIPKLYSYSLNKKPRKIVMEYINGEKVSIFDFFNIYKKKINLKKKIIISKHILNLKKKYNMKKTKNIINKTFNSLNRKQSYIFISPNHGDLVHYNCLKKNNNIYIFDFEKFSQTITPFDALNWFVHPITLNIRKMFFINSKNYFLIIINKFILFFFFYIIKKRTGNIFLNLNINKKNFYIYLKLYILEKILIIEQDLKFVKNKDKKKIAREHIEILKYINQNINCNS